jgi:hypothetical protein
VALAHPLKSQLPVRRAYYHRSLSHTAILATSPKEAILEAMLQASKEPSVKDRRNRMNNRSQPLLGVSESPQSQQELARPRPKPLRAEDRAA